MQTTFPTDKRPIALNGPKFPYENELDYCGPCRSAIFAEAKTQEDMESSQPVFYNPVVTQMEAKSTSSTTVVISSTSGAVPATMVLAPQRQPRTEDDFGSRLRATMAARNEALGQSEITAKSEEAMRSYRATRIQDGKPSGATSTPQTSVQPPKAKGSIAPPMSGPGGPIAVAKNVAATAAQVKKSAIPQVQK